MHSRYSVVLIALFCSVASATMYRSSSLGWAAGSTVDTQLASFLSGTAAAGDTLQLDAMYTITAYESKSRAYNTFPDTFTLIAVMGGGFDCAGSRGDTSVPGYYFYAGKNMTLDNCTFKSSSAPETGFSGNNPVEGTDFHKGIMWNARAGGLTVRWCRFSGNLEGFLEVSGKFTIRNSSFHRGKYQFHVAGPSEAHLYQSLWDDALIDGIKAGVSAGSNANWLVDDCIFQESRDGIDVTGGLQNSEIRNSIFRHLNVTAFDAKFVFDNPDDLNNTHAVVKNVVFNDCEFIDIRNCIVATFGKNTDNPATWAQQEALVPQHITTNRCVYERTPQNEAETGSQVQMYLVKMGHHIIWNNAIARGNLTNDIRTLNDQVQDGWTCHDNYGTITDTLTARDKNHDIHFLYGPQEGTVAVHPAAWEMQVLPDMSGTKSLYDALGRSIPATGSMPTGVYLEYDGAVLIKRTMRH